jgi:predicted CxxxxCH...CXXCH cytochrome family protein
MRMNRVGPFAMVGVVAAALASGCGSSRTSAEASAGLCTSCHGGADNATGAPPVGVTGNPAAIGAHTVHVQAGVACASCHVVPSDIGLPGHPDGGRAEVTFGGLAAAGLPVDRTRTGPPVYQPTTLTCSAVYCHGGTLDAGGSNDAPSWGQVLPFCGTCHAFPPPSHAGYADRLLCATCHGAAIEADNSTFKPPHLDGTLDFN